MPDTHRHRGLRGGVLAALLVGLWALPSCSGGESAGPPAPDLELRRLSGAGQFAEPGGTLDAPFVVEVRSRASQKPQDGVTVEWRVVEGSGATLSAATTTTGSDGTARVTLTLGSEAGLYRVRASLSDGRDDPVDFEARAATAPVLDAVVGGPFAPGDTVRLEGSGFISELDQLVVTFDGIRGPVHGGGGSSLEVGLPSCLPRGPVEVKVALGDLRSEGREAVVEGEGPTLELAPGEARTLEGDRGLECVRLPSDAEARYLANVHSTSTLGAAVFDYGLALRVGRAPATASPAATPRGGGRAPARVDAARRWEARLRRLEREAVAERGGRPAGSPSSAPAPARVPEVGQTRRFEVLNREGSFDEVTAVVRHVGSRAVIYVDRNAPEGGFREGDLAAFGAEFDDPIHPVVTGVFGDESDLDGNGRVVILFTPVVNGLTERGTGSFIGGFFFGIDLLEDREGSNGGEIFYALVPDPEGEFGDPRSRHRVLETVPAILAHEFQHMVHFNERVLVRGASSTEALWLSEALATASEELVARTFFTRGRPERGRAFREGNYVRAIRFFRDPGDVSLVVSSGQGSLAERGAGWLLMRYLEGRTGGTGFLTDLTRTTRTGVANVEAETGLGWPGLLSDWSSALFLDGTGAPVPSELTFVDFDLLEELRTVDGRFSREAPLLGGGDLTRVRSIRPSATDPVVLEPSAPGGLAVSLAGPLGGPPDSGAALRLRLVRLR